MAKKPVTETNEEAAEDLNRSLVPPTPSLPPMVLGEGSGEVEQSDVQPPQIRIVHGVGDLSAIFTPGDLVLNKEYRIAAKQELLSMTVLSYHKYYKEVLEYDPDSSEFPRTFNTKEEAHAAGLTTEWQDDPNKPGRRFIGVREAATLTLLVEKPEKLDCPMFSLQYNDRYYTPALLYLDKSAYKTGVVPIISAHRMQLAVKGLLAGRFTLKTESKPIGGNQTVIPVVRLDGTNDPEFVDWIKSTFGG